MGISRSFVYPALGGALDGGFFRIGGAGLGNLMLSWARAAALAHRLDLPMLTPIWSALKIGPKLRRERDSRMYRGMFRDEPEAIDGLAKLRAFAGLRHVEQFVDPSLVERSQRRTLYVTRPHHIAPEWFSGLFDHNAMLSRRLLDMTCTPILDRVAALPPADIAVHVRMGDFLPVEADAPLINRRLPLDWYADRIDAARAALGPDPRIILFSDGSREDLAPLLARDNVTLQEGENALVDLYSMARARALIGSSSTFSLWASFLGRMPSLWHPGGMLQAFPADHSLRLESPFGADVPEDFAARFRTEGLGDVATRLRGARR